jgi:hypothetical protein
MTYGAKTKTLKKKNRSDIRRDIYDTLYYLCYYTIYDETTLNYTNESIDEFSQGLPIQFTTIPSNPSILFDIQNHEKTNSGIKNALLGKHQTTPPKSHSTNCSQVYTYDKDKIKLHSKYFFTEVH